MREIRLFIRKTVLFLAVTVLLGLVCFMGVINYVRNGNFYKVPKNTHSLLLGHSQPACAFNDEIIVGLYNVSQFTEGYPYSYYKAKYLLERNPQIKYVYIEYTNNQIGYWAKERVFGAYMSQNMERMLPFLEYSFLLKAFLASKNPIEIFRSCYLSFKKNMEFIISRSSNFAEDNWHNHKAPDHIFNSDTTVKPANKKEFVNIFEMQEENIRYLFKLKQLCVNRKTRLFLVRSPLPKHIRDGNSNEAFFRLIKDTYLNEIPLLDFSMYPLDLKYFADNSHLNVEGSKVFSKFFYDSIVNTALLEHEEAEELVNQKIKTIAK